jgi:predicted ATP-dependent endonuclease of OLD family
VRINNLTIDSSITSKVGLEAINLTGLGTVVALIGKNGSGKTRILDLLQENFESFATWKNFLKHNLLEPPEIILNALVELRPYAELFSINEAMQEVVNLRRKDRTNAKLMAEYTALKQRRSEINLSLNPAGILNNPTPNSPEKKIEQIISKIAPFMAKLGQNYIQRIKYSEIQQLQEAIEDKGDESLSFESLVDSLSDNIDYNEIHTIHSSSLKFLKKLPHQLVSDFIECLGDMNKLEKRVSYKRYLALRKIFADFFGKTLEWEMKSISKNVTDKGVESVQAGIWKTIENLITKNFPLGKRAYLPTRYYFS